MDEVNTMPGSDHHLELPNGWVRSRLGEVAEFVNGDRGVNYPKKADRTETGVPFINTGHIEPNGRLSCERMEYIPRERFDLLRSGKVRAGDIVYCLRGSTIGKTALSFFQEGAIASSLVIIRANERAVQRFLYYFLTSPQGQGLVAQHDNGSAQPNLSVRVLSQYPLPLPPIAQQEAIVQLLQALDDRIELNRQTNETLEALARAIFKDWFVDFGPTRAKAEGRAPYLAPDLWSLFPDRLDAEGKPEGWQRERIGEHVKAAKGLSYKGSGLTTAVSGMPLHNLNSVLEGGGYKTTGLKFYAGDYKPKHMVQPGDLIVANTEQGFDHLLIGYSAIVPRWAGKEALFSHHLYRVDPLSVSPLSRTWLHFALSASCVGDVIRRFSNGTTVNMLPSDAFELPEIPVPRKEIVSAFDGLVEPMLRRQEDSFGESQTLAQTRDLLLPKLMSGEIRLRDAEKIVEEAA